MNKTKVAISVLAVAFILSLGLLGIKLQNVGKAEMIINKCFIVPNELVLFQVTGYKQEALELSGSYKIQGVQFIISFQEYIPQKKLEGGIELGYIVPITCEVLDEVVE